MRGGNLPHFVGHACQPLHISYLFNGDPDDLVPGFVRDPQKHEKRAAQIPNGTGVHSAYEDDMVNTHVPEIMAGIDQRIKSASPLPLVTGGHNAAVAVVELMNRTFAAVPPRKIIDVFLPIQEEKPSARASALWTSLGDGTMDVMADGCFTLAQIWDSAWEEGSGDNTMAKTVAVSETALERLYQDPDFMPSHTLDTISTVLEATSVSAASSRRPGAPPSHLPPAAKKSKAARSKRKD